MGLILQMFFNLTELVVLTNWKVKTMSMTNPVSPHITEQTEQDEFQWAMFPPSCLPVQAGLTVGKGPSAFPPERTGAGCARFYSERMMPNRRADE